jgi:hypothetical protein
VPRAIDGSARRSLRSRARLSEQCDQRGGHEVDPRAAAATIHWNATDGDKGTLTLQADLPAGATTQVLGTAGQDYQCSAYFLTQPDLVAMNAEWKSNDEAVVTLGNKDAWLDAPPSVARVETVSCGGSVIASYETIPFTVNKSTNMAFKVPVKRAVKAYLRLTVDAKSQVAEKDETNNVFSDSDPCVK